MIELSFMGYVALFLLGVGLLAYFVGWILLLIAAFRRHPGWGLANLLVPGANLVFVVMHWAEARRGFLAQVMGAVLLGVGILAANDGNGLAGNSSNGGAHPGSADADSALRAKEAEVRKAEEDLSTLQAKVNADYEALKMRRAKLGSDPAALAAFNQDAAAYAAARTELSVKAGRLAQLRADEVRLTDAVFLEAREAAKSKPKAIVPVAAVSRPAASAATPKPISVAAGDVVMYTTSRCPACIAAKQYFARRGVPYKEINVENDREGRADFQKRGGQSVPLIVVKGRQMVGFNQRELEKLL